MVSPEGVWSSMPLAYFLLDPFFSIVADSTAFAPCRGFKSPATNLPNISKVPQWRNRTHFTPVIAVD